LTPRGPEYPSLEPRASGRQEARLWVGEASGGHCLESQKTCRVGPAVLVLAWIGFHRARGAQ